MGSDVNCAWIHAEACQFQSTLPAWGATKAAPPIDIPTTISIHAPRMGSDEWAGKVGEAYQFQSTLPAWGATNLKDAVKFFDRISIHAPRMGSDYQWQL